MFSPAAAPFEPLPAPVDETDYSVLMEKVRGAFNVLTELMIESKKNRETENLITLSLVQKQLFDVYSSYRSKADKMPMAPQVFHRGPNVL